MQTTNVKIKFETFNDHNFLIDIAGNDANALHGLALLQEELPAEISFHVPEAYHKRIIGVGGKSMKPVIRCAVAAWVSGVLFLIPKVENMLGQVRSSCGL